jgi:AP-1 complex subunit gamma-1
LNLLGGAAAAPAAAPAKPAGGASLMDDLLGGGLLGGGGLAPSPVAAAPAPAAGGGLFGLAPTPAPAAAAPAGEITAYDKAGVRITFSGKKHPTNAQLTMVRASFHNLTAAPVSQFVMQVAVPKYITLQLDPATGTDLPPGSSGAVTQVLKLANSLHGERPLLMKLKIDYATPFGPQSDLVDFTLAGF